MTRRPSDSQAERARGILRDRVHPKVSRLLERRPFDFPVVTEGGRWVDSPVERWSDGFWPGIFWLAWRASGDDRLRAAAEDCLERVAPRMERADANYDLGFQYFYSFALGHRLTGEPAYRETALMAARRLCDFFREPARLITITYPERIEQFGRPRVTSKIDVMMNLTLLWWAHAETGERRFLDVARGHAERSLQCFLGPEGRTWELADFDPESGDLLMQDRVQGLGHESCWARAQAWGVYGFLQAAHHTGEAAFLDAALRALRFWQDHVPPDGVPYWDLLAAPPHRDARDASAAAILLAGLVRGRSWELRLPPCETLIDATLTGLGRTLAPDRAEGVLDGGCAYYRKGEGLHGATAWGEYYFIEAIAELAGLAVWESA